MKRFLYLEYKAILVVSIFLVVTFLIFFSIMLLSKQEIGKIIFLLWCLVEIYMIWYLFWEKIVIDEIGVRFITLFKKNELNWNEIKEIGIGHFYPRGSRGPDYIYFSKHDELLGNLIYPKMVGRDFIIMQYRQKAIDEIRRYWDKPL